MVQPERVRILRDADGRPGKYVLYWMQQAQRAELNHALEFAVAEANDRGQPVVVVFGLTDRFPDANLRHYAFMLEGLRETREALRARGIQLVVLRESPDDAALALSGNASLLVTDRGYLRIQKEWRESVARRVDCTVVEAETDVVVPVEVVSTKEEYSAATIRPKIHRQLKRFLVPMDPIPVRRDSTDLRLEGERLDDMDRLLLWRGLDRGVRPVDAFRGGYSNAKRLLDSFISKKLKYYAERRNDPSLDYASHMSPYLHFGQISPLYIALCVQSARGVSRKAKDAFLEELIVRRELSMNFVNFNLDYDRYESIPHWARQSLASHLDDRREYVYSREEFEQARTHDPYWNAAQREMVVTGTMHNYMRMYWGKKIIEWSATPEEAFRTALYLNNRYELDGRDANGFAGVAWCFGKHDRPWGERPIFGNVRYMNAGGLERKFDIDAYVRRIEALR